LESPQPILELEDVIPIVEAFCTSYKWSILFPRRQMLLTLEDLIWWITTEVQCSKRRNLSSEGVIKVIIDRLRILDPDVMRFWDDHLVGIGIFYLATKSQLLNRSRVVNWLMVVQ
jgi:hypothetical protein